MVFSVIAGDTQIIILEENRGAGQLTRTEGIWEHFTYSAGAHSPFGESLFNSTAQIRGQVPPLTGPQVPSWPHHCAYLAHSAVPARLHMMLALVAGVDEAVLALCVQLH